MLKTTDRNYMKPSEFKSGSVIYTRLTTNICICGILLKQLLAYKYINSKGETKHRIYCWVKSTNGRNQVISLRTAKKFHNKSKKIFI